ncbi:TIGR03986 family type III CRISPR-associated RAMP protein [Sporomusa termitida]|nr:TIGR03986 family CRISPR-associated RAMP protein [Sporomusa termitida]
MENERPRNMDNRLNQLKAYKEVILPYDFVPFSATTYYPYQKTRTGSKGNRQAGNLLPGHDRKENNNVSGFVQYTLQPCSDLVLETREKLKGGYFVSGSQFRGRIRANLEILSASYPQFVNTTPLLYRDLAGDLSKLYREKLGLVKNKGIEHVVQAGFLIKNENDFYVIPAPKIGDKNFLSIKEHRLIQMQIDKSAKQFSPLFCWDSNKISTFARIQKQIDDMNEKVLQRRQLQFEMKKKYFGLVPNDSFIPYQQRLFAQVNENHTVDNLSFAKLPEEKCHLAYLFNSTNASSKRSHYLVLEPGQNDRNRNHSNQYKVSDALIAAYQQNLKKNRAFDEETEIGIMKKQFYDIFGSYDNILMRHSGSVGLVVFFQLDGEKLKNIGRTPYFKIPCRHQLTSLLGIRKQEKVDCASALFGFTAEKEPADQRKDVSIDTIPSYKSRLRFTSLDIELADAQTLELQKQPFLLPTPYASACAMYLEQPEGKSLQTYEQPARPQLNGYKYYHILPKQLKVQNQADWPNPNMLSYKPVIKYGSVRLLRGKIYFHNLTKAELGVLLLSLEPKQLLKTRQYGPQAEQFRSELEQAYDLVGGAKPYGYGKVKIEVRQLALEKSGRDFTSLVVDTEEIIADATWGEYIDAFIADMGGGNYFNTVHFRQYLQSKLELQDASELITWDQLPKKIAAETNSSQGGYPKHWRLKRTGKKS